MVVFSDFHDFFNGHDTVYDIKRIKMIRIVPLFIKDFVVRTFYTKVQDKNSSAGLTNMVWVF